MNYLIFKIIIFFILFFLLLSVDLNGFIESASSVDLMTTLGIIENPLEPRACQDIVFDAMKLDISARNKIPSSCSIWLGSRMLPISITMQNVTFPSMVDIISRFKSLSMSKKERRYLVELFAIFKYPVLCEKRINEAYFSSDANTNTNANTSVTEKTNTLSSKSIIDRNNDDDVAAVASRYSIIYSIK